MKKSAIIYSVAIIFFLLVMQLFFISCSKKSSSEGEYQIDEEEDTINIDLGSSKQTIDWESEKERLKGVGQIKNVQDYCSIMVLWRKELDKNGYNTMTNFTEEEKQKINALKESFLTYFGITPSDFDHYGQENSNAIEQYILSNPVYQDALISIEGSEKK
ncbi:MAG TPA: hypothetical protein PK520_04555 [Exilispira sp.]|nr:hypothetical protein [Exilispira sp.]HQQ19338.1 hypothetical protein [Exilispira sp.]